MEENIYDKNRVINFSDAVFSIAMTLLVLEISIPAYAQVKEEGTLSALSSLIPSFIGFLVSFLVIALYWVAHLRISKYIDQVNGKLLWLNIFLLMFVVLLPFSTAFYVGSVTQNGPFIFYSINLAVIGFFNFLIARYVLKSQPSGQALTKPKKQWLLLVALNSAAIWILAALIAPIFPVLSRYIWILIFVFQYIITRRLKKQLAKAG